jgi:uncharacterized YigZ family protein
LITPDYYQTIEGPAVAEFKDRGSRFMAFAFPLKNESDFKVLWKQLKKEHPKAVHHCFAYRLGTTGDIFRASDDGEPSGTAGRPILGQLDSKKLTNLVIIVVRYFGGTLLGVPGLINAYRTAAQLALDASVLVKRKITKLYEFQFEYPKTNEVLNILKDHDCIITAREHLLFSVIQAEVPVNNLKSLISKLSILDGVEIRELV